MQKNFLNKKRKAQVFLMSSLILAGSVALGLALVSVYLKNLRMSYEISESVRAFYAADSCAEWRLYEFLIGEGFDKIDSKWNPQLSNKTECTYDPEYEEFNQIKSMGTSNIVSRGINIYFPEKDID